MSTPSDAAIDLAFAALDHGIRSVSSGETLVAFTLEQGPEGRRLLRFAADRIEEGTAIARSRLSSDHGADTAAAAWDGYVTLEGARSDAIFVHVGERGADASYLFAQRYRPKALFRRFERIGAPALVAVEPPLF